MRREEDGFTLIELLLSVAILVIVLGSISAAFIVFLQNGTESLERDDNSGGAAISASYIDRDVASADAVSTGGTACSGSTNIVVLSWFEYTASSPSPIPVPGAQPYRSAYSVVVDPSSVPAGGGTRYKLQRTYCLGSTILDRSTLIPNLLDATTKATAVVATDSSCASNQALTIRLGQYSADTTDPYMFRSCTKTRLS